MGDPEGTISGAYKVDWPLIGRTKRVTYLIGRNRRVRLAFHDELHMDAHVARACTVAAEPDGPS